MLCDAYVDICKMLMFMSLFFKTQDFEREDIQSQRIRA
jgi:hypothetical protein